MPEQAQAPAGEQRPKRYPPRARHAQGSTDRGFDAFDRPATPRTSPSHEQTHSSTRSPRPLSFISLAALGGERPAPEQPALRSRPAPFARPLYAGASRG